YLITPLAALEPEIAAEDASFITVIFSISPGERDSSEPVTPSINTNGPVLPPKLPRPLIKRFGLSRPGSPEGCVTCKPGILPCSIFAAFGTGRSFSVFPSTVAKDPDTLDLRWTPYPTTTTSSKVD